MSAILNKIYYNIFSYVSQAKNYSKNLVLYTLIFDTGLYLIKIIYIIKNYIIFFSIFDFLYFIMWAYFVYGIFSKVYLLTIFILPDIFLFIGAVYIIVYFVTFQCYSYFYVLKKDCTVSPKAEEILLINNVDVPKYFINQFTVFKNMIIYIKLLIKCYFFFLVYTVYNFFLTDSTIMVTYCYDSLFVDPISLTIKIFIALSIVLVMHLLDHSNRYYKVELLIVLYCSFISLFFIVSFFNFFFFFIAIEFLFICVIILLIGLTPSLYSINATLTYFFVNTVASLIMLMGIILIYGLFGSISYKSIHLLCLLPFNNDPNPFIA
jgi:hypothetical protein